ncbi:hypothetical protein SAMN05192553_101313 [Cyclobacterium xiamenense]|uniref:2'-5' RNA ligase n=1 Tax=Cyclobacterium xiamenense TaxID=1297121 RepID=A0A1H6TQA7_9BACT|nr:hypothetical protein [Cyclobacterium xiamenense]SEI79397.1 hypothetical protein SAMN05192553_101313 [Cyclobacterium xiamenense]
MKYLKQDLSFSEHNDHQVCEVKPLTLCEKGDHFQFGKKFRLVNGKWETLPYRGFAFVCMVKDNSGNDSLLDELRSYQQQLLTGALRDQIYPLPPDSFHQTIANLLSGSRFATHIETPGLTTDYPRMVEQALREIVPFSHPKPLVMQMIGLGIFGSAFGVLGIIPNETDYNKIVYFRNKLYQAPQMNRMGIQWTRPFIGHITLGYFGEDIVKSDVRQKQLIERCISLNQTIKKEGHKFTLHTAQLRRYEDLSRFEHPSNYPEWIF